MAREFSPDNVVSLPRLNVDSALTLWQALRTGVVAEKKLPKFVQPSWKRVDSAGTVLSQAAQTRFNDSSSKAPAADKRKADNDVDHAGGALYDYLGVWLQLPGTLPEVQIAAAALQAIYPDGKDFLNLPYLQEWAQIDRRLTLLKSEGLDKQIASIGGLRFVEHLQQMHLAYGKALGVTTVPEAPTETVALLEPLSAFASALRLYVIKVMGYRDEEDPETEALADRLLRPLTTWASPAAKSSADSEPTPDPAATPDDPAAEKK